MSSQPARPQWEHQGSDFIPGQEFPHASSVGKKCILKTVRKDDEGKQVDEYVRTPFDDFSLYFKVVYSHYKYRRVLIYSTIVFILGFLASSAVSFLQSLWNLTTDKYAWAFWLVILITVTLIFALCLKFRCRTN